MTRKKPLGLRLSDAERAVKRAVLARDMHAGECTEWDYENPDACLDCAHHTFTVKQAREALRKIQGETPHRPPSNPSK